MHKIVYTANFLEYRRVTLRILSALRVTKKIEKTRDAAPPCYARIFSIREFSWIRERLSYDFLLHYETKNFRRKIAIPQYYAWLFFDTRKVLKFWNTEVFPNVFFNTVKQNFLTKPWCPPRVLHDSCLYQTFLKYRCVPSRISSALWDYLFSTENWDNLTLAPLYLFIHNFFQYQRISEKQKGSSMKFSGHERQKKFDTPVIHLTPMHEKLLYQNSFEIQMCSPTNFIGTVKKFLGKKVIPFSYAWVFLYRKCFEIQIKSTRNFVGTMRQKNR